MYNIPERAYEKYMPPCPLSCTGCTTKVTQTHLKFQCVTCEKTSEHLLTSVPREVFASLLDERLSLGGKDN